MPHKTIPASVIKPLRSTLRGIVIATVILYIALIGAGAYVYAEDHTTQQSICALRGDLETRVHEGKVFLVEHPKGFGSITAHQIQESINNEKRTIDALSDLAC